MDLYLEYAPVIDRALSDHAHGEKVGWALAPATLGSPDGTQAVMSLRLVLWTPSPVLGQMLHAAVPIIDPFLLLEDGGKGLAQLVVQQLEALRQLASEQLTV